MRYIDIVRSVVRNAKPHDIPALTWDEQKQHINAIRQKIDDIEIVVRCKDCRKQGSDDCPMFNREWRVIMQGGKCVDNFIFHDLTKPSGFCNYGERRNDECK